MSARTVSTTSSTTCGPGSSPHHRAGMGQQAATLEAVRGHLEELKDRRRQVVQVVAAVTQRGAAHPQERVVGGVHAPEPAGGGLSTALAVVDAFSS